MGTFYIRRSISFIEPTIKWNICQSSLWIGAQCETLFRFMQSLDITEND